MSGRTRPRWPAVAARVRALRDADPAALRPPAVLRLVRDVILLVKDLSLDPRVPRRAKIVAGLAVAYLLSPVDLVPDTVPVLGQLDDLGVVAYAVTTLVDAAGADLVRAIWRGSPEGLALVLTLAGVQE
ncbi:MAG TPA: DUF1232 domain-containing protein [Egibacteraceae bacterium]